MEAVFGLFAHSLALVADAGHNLSDVLSLLLAWGASRIWAEQTQQTLHLWSAQLVDSRFASERHHFTHRDRRDRVGSIPALQSAARSSGRDCHGGSRLWGIDQCRNGAAFYERAPS